MRRLTFELMEEMGVSETDSFLSDADSTANAGGLYTTNYYLFLDPHTRDYNNGVIKRMITENATGDNVITYAEGTRQGSFELQNSWANRKTLTYKSFQL